MKTVLILAIIFLSGCAVQSVKLPLPESPTLPKVEKGSLGCISDETAAILKRRDILRINYEDKLESIIRSTH